MARGRHDQGEWHGKLAGKFELAGSSRRGGIRAALRRPDPHTAEQLVYHRIVQEYEGADGKSIAPVEHRAGWDATFSAPKSVSLTALVGRR